MGETRHAYKILTTTLRGKEQLVRPTQNCRWDNNINMDLKEIGSDDINWIHLAQKRVQWQVFMNMAINLQVP
jgi:hypothetical protein